MKKHIIAALVGVMILAVTAPAFAAANVGGTLNYGYTYDTPDDFEDVSSGWGVNLGGNVSDNVMFKLGFEQDRNNTDGYLPPVGTSDSSTMPDLSEAWIQAKDTPVGTVKLGAFDAAYGEGNNVYWEGFNNGSEDMPLNVQVSNEFAGMNLTGGAQFQNSGSINAVGASASIKPMEGLDATVGVRADNLGSSWETGIGYSAAFTGVDNLALGVMGNLRDEEIVGTADYKLMPGVTVSGKYGQNAWNADDEVYDDSIMKAGAAATFGNIHGGASYEVAERGIEHRIVRLNAGYDYELTQGLTVGLAATHKIDNSVPYTTVGATAGINF